MAPSDTQREVVVEFDGLFFRIQKLRGRRGFRAVRALQISLGREGYLMLSSPKFWEADETTQLTALIAVESRTETGYDEFEQALVELLAYTPTGGGQGVSYRESPPDPEEPGRGWVPIRSSTALDPYDSVDHTTWQALRWEMIKLCYRPTLAAGGTNADTPSVATTSTPAKPQRGVPTKPKPGTPRAETKPLGISGGS